MRWTDPDEEDETPESKDGAMGDFDPS